MEGVSSFQSGVILTLTEFVGDYGAKIQNDFMTFGGYNALAFELRGMLRNKPLSLVNAYWDGISNIMTMGLGYTMGERLTTEQYAGAFLISAGLFLLSKGKQTL